MSDNGYYEHDLMTWLEIQIMNYEYDRQKYWGGVLSEGEYGFMSRVYEQAERFADAVLTSAETLLSAEHKDDGPRHLRQETERIRGFPEYFNIVSKRIWDSDISVEEKCRRMKELFHEHPADPEDENSPLRLVWERLFIDLAQKAINRTDEGTKRMFQLYGLVLQTHPSPATQKFLSRLGRCYIWGFDPECVMLCRSVIDTAFGEAVSDDLCEKHPRDGRVRLDLAHKIWIACEEGMIDKSTQRIADCVRLRGNTAIHGQPDATKDVFGTIRDTVAVLERLAKK
jgi:hypothetical protein